MIPVLIGIYIFGAIAVPVVMTVSDGPDPDPMEFAFGCFFGLTWPIYAPFVLLWLAIKTPAAVAEFRRNRR